jgi:hypothetical protein
MVTLTAISDTATVDSRGKMTGLSVKKGDFVNVVAFGQQWWMARSANGEAGSE